MIRFLLIGMSVPEGGAINLWGINLETYSVVNGKQVIIRTLIFRKSHPIRVA